MPYGEAASSVAMYRTARCCLGCGPGRAAMTASLPPASHAGPFLDQSDSLFAGCPNEPWQLPVLRGAEEGHSPSDRWESAARLKEEADTTP